VDFSSILVLAVIVALIYFATKIALKVSLKTPTVKATGGHPAATLQQAIGAAGSRGWKVDVQGGVVVARRTANSRSAVRVSIQPSGAGSQVTGTVDTGAEGLRGMGALAMRRSAILAAVS
jgi:hypothetical protein